LLALDQHASFTQSSHKLPRQGSLPSTPDVPENKLSNSTNKTPSPRKTSQPEQKERYKKNGLTTWHWKPLCTSSNATLKHTTEYPDTGSCNKSNPPSSPLGNTVQPSDSFSPTQPTTKDASLSLHSPTYPSNSLITQSNKPQSPNLVSRRRTSSRPKSVQQSPPSLPQLP
jgi:hypothetical protein